MFSRTGRIESVRGCNGIPVVAHFRVDRCVPSRFRKHCRVGGVIFELVRKNFQTI